MKECGDCKNYEPKVELKKPRRGYWKQVGSNIDLYENGAYQGMVIKKNCTSQALDAFLETLK